MHNCFELSSGGGFVTYDLRVENLTVLIYKLRVTFYELKLDIYESMRQILRVEYLSYELQVGNLSLNLRVTRYFL